MPEVRSARRRSPIDDGEPAGRPGHVEDGGHPAVDVEDQEHERGEPRPEEHERLEDVRPHDRGHAARGDIEDRDDDEDRNRRAERPAQEDRDGERRRHQPDAGAEEARDEEEKRRRDLARPAESVGQELVDRRHVVPVEGRDEEPRNGELGEARADEELRVLPVLTVRRRGHGDDRDGADLGGQEAEARRPRRDPATREEEVDRVALAPCEPDADRQENDERGAKDDVVRPGEHWLLYAGTGFSAGYRVGDQAGAPETRSLCAQSRRRPDGPTLRSAC